MGSRRGKVSWKVNYMMQRSKWVMKDISEEELEDILTLKYLTSINFAV